MLELLIADARIVDGSGAPWFVGHVGLADGRIASIGEGPRPAAREVVDASGCYLAPGFVDVHTHDDLAMLREPGRFEKVAQGVTTIVTGNCSFSNYPFVEAGAGVLREHLGSLLGTVSEQEIFADHSGYSRALAAAGIGPNVVSLVGHGPLRLAARGYAAGAVTAEERSRMEALLDRQLQQGAAGLSLGLVYPPSSWADRQELVGLASVVARHGKLLAAHVRNYDNGLEDAIDEFVDLLRASGAKGLLSHLQVCGRENWGKMPALLDRLEAIRREGVDITCDMYPYTAGSSTILQLLPPSSQEGGIDAIVEKLAEPASRETLRRVVSGEVAADPNWQSKITQIGWHNLRIGGVEEPSLKRYEGRFIAEAADEERRDPFDLAAELIACDCGRTNLIMFQQDEGDLRRVLGHRLHMAGSDSIPRAGGKPHPRAAGTFARLIAGAGNADAPPLEEVIRRMTSLPAQRFGLWDRGLIKPGMAADLVLFGDAAGDRATYDDPRLPPVGVNAVLVGGVPVVEHGRATGQLPGRVLRANLPPPSQPEVS